VLPPSLSRSVTSMPPERRTTAAASGEADGSFSGYEPSFSPPCSPLDLSYPPPPPLDLDMRDAAVARVPANFIAVGLFWCCNK
jgi:hypothetical protein